MSKDMYLMQHGFISDIEDEEFEDFAHDSFEEILHSFMHEKIKIYRSRMTDEPIVTEAVIQNDITDNPEFAYMRTLLVREDLNLQCGNYIEREDGTIWLVPYLPGTNGIFKKVYIWFCNFTVRFLSSVTGKIVAYPTHTENATRYNSGEREYTQMLIGTSQHVVYVPNNEETIVINNGNRFLFDTNTTHPTAMRVTQVDSTSYAYGYEVNLVRWTMLEDQYNPLTDNAELGAADYKSYNSEPAHEGGSMFG